MKKMPTWSNIVYVNLIFNLSKYLYGPNRRVEEKQLERNDFLWLQNAKSLRIHDSFRIEETLVFTEFTALSIFYIIFIKALI